MPRCLLCAALLSVLALTAAADEPTMKDHVTLKNGDHLTGAIVSGDGKTLLLKTEFAGDVTIKWDAISAIESSQELNLTLKDGGKLSGKVATEDGKYVVTRTAPASAPGSAPKDVITAIRSDAEQKAFDINAEKMAHRKFTYFWSGLFDTGLALTRGNSATTSYTLSMKAVRETPRDKITVYSTYVYANDQTVVPSRTTANAILSGVRGDLNLSPHPFVFALADFQSDQLQNLDLRQVYGGGFGDHVIKNDRTAFDVFGGFTYDHDAFGAYTIPNPTPPPLLTSIAAITQNSGEGLAGEEFDSKLSKRTTVAERFSIFPNITHLGDYRMQFDASVASQLKNWLSWHVTFTDRYITYPPPGLKGNDQLLSTGLRVTWGKAKL
jgi:putative salt-induced outer membrane protein YdiY